MPAIFAAGGSNSAPGFVSCNCRVISIAQTIPPRMERTIMATITVQPEATISAQPAEHTQQPARQPLGLEPRIDPTARVRECKLGISTSIGPRTSLSESTFGDYSYVVDGCSIVWADIGKFCSIASARSE